MRNESALSTSHRMTGSVGLGPKLIAAGLTVAVPAEFGVDLSSTVPSGSGIGSFARMSVFASGATPVAEVKPGMSLIDA